MTQYNVIHSEGYRSGVEVIAHTFFNKFDADNYCDARNKNNSDEPDFFYVEVIN